MIRFKYGVEHSGSNASSKIPDARVSLEWESVEDACRFCCSFSSWSSEWSKNQSNDRHTLVNEIIEERSKFNVTGLFSITEEIPSTPIDTGRNWSGCCECFFFFSPASMLNNHPLLSFRSVDRVEHAGLSISSLLSSRFDVDYSNPSFI